MEYTRVGLMPSTSAMAGFCMVPRAIKPESVLRNTQRIAINSKPAITIKAMVYKLTE
jgi:hypothetical protein